jgi:hypothetical protein
MVERGILLEVRTCHGTTQRDDGEIRWQLTSWNVAIKFEKLREMAYIYCTAMQVAWLTRECMRGEGRGADAVYPHRERD